MTYGMTPKGQYSGVRHLDSQSWKGPHISTRMACHSPGAQRQDTVLKDPEKVSSSSEGLEFFSDSRFSPPIKPRCPMGQSLSLASAWLCLIWGRMPGESRQMVWVQIPESSGLPCLAIKHHLVLHVSRSRGGCSSIVKAVGDTILSANPGSR